jgi:hypothetical protein
MVVDGPAPGETFVAALLSGRISSPKSSFPPLTLLWNAIASCLSQLDVGRLLAPIVPSGGVAHIEAHKAIADAMFSSTRARSLAVLAALAGVARWQDVWLGRLGLFWREARPACHFSRVTELVRMLPAELETPIRGVVEKFQHGVPLASYADQLELERHLGVIAEALPSLESSPPDILDVDELGRITSGGFPMNGRRRLEGKTQRPREFKVGKAWNEQGRVFLSMAIEGHPPAGISSKLLSNVLNEIKAALGDGVVSGRGRNATLTGAFVRSKKLEKAWKDAKNRSK